MPLRTFGVGQFAFCGAGEAVDDVEVVAFGVPKLFNGQLGVCLIEDGVTFGASWTLSASGGTPACGIALETGVAFSLTGVGREVDDAELEVLSVREETVVCLDTGVTLT
jgi:hypothetical protein